MSIKYTSSFLVTALAYSYSNEIKNIIIYTCTYIYEKTQNRIIIKTEENPKCAFAIREKILESIPKGRKLVANDGVKQPNYRTANGSYNVDGIKIIISQDEIILSTNFLNSIDGIKNFMNKTYGEYCSSDKTIVFFTSDENKWSFPIFRTPRNITKMRITERMNEVVNNVDIFLTERSKYEDQGVPYRKGYLLYGQTGTGKSATIEVIAIKYDMSVYLLNLNSKEMTDTILINLVSQIGPRSILVIEEIDKQLETLKQNNNYGVSMGGLLTALDGPQRLSNGTIVIITTNDETFFKGNEALLRKGRIDEVYKFDEKMICLHPF